MKRYLFLLGVVATLALTAVLVRGTGSGGRASASGVTAVSGGYGHTCAVTAGGGLKCWGYNSDGQIGDGTTTQRTTPVDVSGLTSGVSAVTASASYHTCALTTGGGVKCWGANNNGQLGDGTTTPRLTPVDVSNLTSGVAAISAGLFHTCALTTAGGVKCWGLNTRGQLGNATTSPSSIPVDVFGLTSGVSAIAAGNEHTCAIMTSGGTVKCWGKNDVGELGAGFNSSSGCTCVTTPIDVVGLGASVTAIDAGGYQTCAVRSGGAKCWGANSSGQVGDGSTTDRYAPVDVSGLTSGVASISAGGSHTCARTSVGGAKCWGYNGQGQVGDGTTTQRLTPVDVSGLTSNVSSVSAGDEHSCAVTTSAGVKCWGANFNGQLGDGIGCITPCMTPVDVFGLGSKPPNSQLNITKLGQYNPPKSCYNVFTSSQTLLFQVCDNDWPAPPATNAVCLHAGNVCTDENLAQGVIQVNISPGDYHVVESVAPPLHTISTAGKQDCNASLGPCSITVIDSPFIRPWFPWDIVGSACGGPDGKVRVDDVTSVVNHYRQEKPLPGTATPTPLPGTPTPTPTPRPGC